jgi:LmbE family N-acetylglucosaminyl deacetylase
MIFRLSLSLFFLLPFFVKAQTVNLNSSEIKSGLKKLDVLGSVLYIAAHPDDENTRLLTYLAKERLVRTGYLSITRGDGGQNLIGKEQSEELGLIRTQELIAARNKDGAEQFFTRANDFGFSKTANETFSIWNKELILSDVVYLIRKFRPDVIITRFPSDSRAGHGHHSASSILAQEAFVAAADANRFPEQLKEVEVWQAKRILWNNYNFGENNTISEDQFKVDVGVYNQLLGKSYGEIAAESRSMHKSQGFGAAKQRGTSIEYFSTLKGTTPMDDLFDGIDLTWKRVSSQNKISTLIKDINNNYDIENPSKSVVGLVNLYQQVKRLPGGYYKDLKLKEIENLIIACSGTWIEAYASKPYISVNTNFNVSINAITQYPGVQISLLDNSSVKRLENNKINTLEISYSISEPTNPYWLVNEPSLGQYNLQKQSDILFPDGPSSKSININIEIAGLSFSVERPVMYKYTDPVKGEVYQSLTITPPATVNFTEKVFLFTDNQPQNVLLKLKSFKDNFYANVKLELPNGWKSYPEHQEVSFEKEGEEKSLLFSITPLLNNETGNVNVSISTQKQNFKQSLKTINYDHIPSIAYFPKSSAKLVKLDLKTSSNKNIGYIEGAGDLIPEALRQIGYAVKIITDDELLNGDLSNYDAIISGVRAYNINEKLKVVQPKLLDYVKNGGVYLVQYNVNRPLVLEDIGPYPFSITRDRVTEENSPVEFLLPESKALNYPNKLTLKDFDGWIQERGLYFISNADSKYQLPLSMKDSEEKASTGSLAIANYGKGKFVYTGLSFFRELPAGVPGAYKLFVNLISK